MPGPKKPKWCFMKKGIRVCAPRGKQSTSRGAGKPGNFQRNKIKKGYSSIQARRRKANKRYLKRKKAGTVRKAGSRTGVKYRKRR